ncbi:hypothetical protein L7F22_033339 [Adiantum nelumboides]|nr:hypothetical protein [Adiantum nelumboides]
MSKKFPHLHSVWVVGQALLSKVERAIVIRFGHDWDQTCIKMDAVLASITASIAKFAVIYVVHNNYKSNDSKINWALKDKQEFSDIIEIAYRG